MIRPGGVGRRGADTIRRGRGGDRKGRERGRGGERRGGDHQDRRQDTAQVQTAQFCGVDRL